MQGQCPQAPEPTPYTTSCFFLSLPDFSLSHPFSPFPSVSVPNRQLSASFPRGAQTPRGASSQVTGCECEALIRGVCGKLLSWHCRGRGCTPVVSWFSRLFHNLCSERHTHGKREEQLPAGGHLAEPGEGFLAELGVRLDMDHTLLGEGPSYGLVTACHLLMALGLCLCVPSTGS